MKYKTGYIGHLTGEILVNRGDVGCISHNLSYPKVSYAIITNRDRGETESERRRQRDREREKNSERRGRER